jgi:hypothetical protein
MKKTDKSADGTSYYGVNVLLTPNQLVQILGEPTYDNNDGGDKVNLEWVCETSEGEVFTVYDWKEYKPLDYYREYEFHIGSFNENICQKAKLELALSLMSHTF